MDIKIIFLGNDYLSFAEFAHGEINVSNPTLPVANSFAKQPVLIGGLHKQVLEGTPQTSIRGHVKEEDLVIMCGCLSYFSIKTVVHYVIHSPDVFSLVLQFEIILKDPLLSDAYSEMHFFFCIFMWHYWYQWR